MAGISACTAEPTGQTSDPGLISLGATEANGEDSDPTGADAGADGTAGGSGAQGTSDGGSRGDGTILWPCDLGVALDPDPPGTGTITWVDFTHQEPLTFVELTMSGPGIATRGALEVIGGDPWTWRWPVTDLSPGVWMFSFAHGESAVTIATCQFEVLDTGLPPPLPGEPPAPAGDCDPGQVCGDLGPGGGTCDRCPMVGDCLEPPAPYGPGGPGTWSCLDSASCNADSGQCRIWCPAEPCNEEAHPDGCPQGVEACFVSGSFASYEQACRSCCESRYHEPKGEYACWDPAFNLCRYPSDCGLPLW